MDEIEFLVSETYKHFTKHYPEEAVEAVDYGMRELKSMNVLPNDPGVLYHIQKSPSIFVLRTIVSQNIRDDYQKILERPEDYPSLRLVEENCNDLESRLRFFIVDDPAQAEIIFDQVSNRRFPMVEELMCNISDPGFSWWMSQKENGFQLDFTMSVGLEEKTCKLGPLGDQQLALRSFLQLESVLAQAGLRMNVQNEVNRVQFSDGDETVMEEFKDLFEFGVISPGLIDLFKFLSKKIEDHSELETLWFYLLEVAAMRRFWIQIQYDLNA